MKHVKRFFDQMMRARLERSSNKTCETSNVAATSDSAQYIKVRRIAKVRSSQMVATANLEAAQRRQQLDVRARTRYELNIVAELASLQSSQLVVVSVAEPK